MAEQAVSVRGPVGSLEKLDVRDVEAIYRPVSYTHLASDITQASP